MLKSAVIGCGAVSKNHGKALKNSEYTHLEYCVDIDIEKAKAFSDNYGGIPLTDYKELFDKNLDCVHVITPHNTHPQIVMDLLDHGINVFCEKPLAITVNEAKAMIKDGLIKVNGEIETRRGKKLRNGDQIQYEEDIYLIHANQ